MWPLIANMVLNIYLKTSRNPDIYVLYVNSLVNKENRFSPNNKLYWYKIHCTMFQHSLSAMVFYFDYLHVKYIYFQLGISFSNLPCASLHLYTDNREGIAV